VADVIHLGICNGELLVIQSLPFLETKDICLCIRMHKCVLAGILLTSLSAVNLEQIGKPIL
jgi:hypothetical protein